MILNIAGRYFDTEDIHELTIRENQNEVFITTNDDFYRIKYRSKRDIEDVIYWKKLSNITTQDVHNAIYTLIITYEFFINSKNQYIEYPLYKNKQYSLLTIPNNWR